MPTWFRTIALLLVFAVAAAAQNWSAVKAVATGTSVRVAAGSRTLTGEFQSATDDSLTVYSGKAQQVFTRQEVTRVRVKKQGHRGRNTLIGLGTGAAAGAIVGAAVYKDCTGWCFLDFGRGGEAGLAAIALGIIGAIVGVLIPTGGWHEVYKQ